MADFVRVPETDWQNILDATRGKTGSTEKMLSGEVATAIAGIVSGGGGSGEYSAAQIKAWRILSNLESGHLDMDVAWGDNPALPADYARGNKCITSVYWSGAPKSVQMRSDAFNGCTNLVSVDFPNAVYWHYNRVFAGCTSLKNVNLPSYSGGIQNDTFNGCTALEEISIPGATLMLSSCFKNCTSLASVNLPLVESIGTTTFYNCTALTVLDLPSLTNIGQQAFAGAKALKTLILRASAVCALVNINAFNGTPFASGGTGGTVYVPQALIS